MRTSKFIHRVFVLISFFMLAKEVSGQSLELFLAKYESQLKTITSETELEQFSKQAIEGIGISSTVMSFINGGFKDRKYTLIIEYLVENRIPGVNRGPLVAYYPKNVESIISTHRSYYQSSPFAILSETMNKLSFAASVYGLGLDVIRAWDGDDKAKLNVIKGSYSFFTGWAMAQYGDYLMGANFISGFLALFDMALTKSIQYTFTYHENLVYQSYENYLRNTYPLDSWISILKNNNLTEVDKFRMIDARLYEFWDNSDAIFRQYVIENNIEGKIAMLGNTGRLVGKKDEFASEYYRTFIESIIVGEFRRQLNQQIQTARMQAQAELDAFNAIVAQAAQLKSELDKIQILDPADTEFSIEDIANYQLLPSESTIKIGGDANLRAIITLKDGRIIDVTEPSAIDQLNNQELKEHTIKAVYRRQEATAIVRVQTEPQLIITPAERTIDINQGDKKIPFSAELSDEYKNLIDVTEKTFIPIYGTNVMEFENIGDYEINISYRHNGVMLHAKGTIRVVGCEDPDKRLNTESGICECDETRGFYSKEIGEDCSQYQSAYADPDFVQGFPGEEYTIRIIGKRPGSGDEYIEEKVVTIKEEGEKSEYLFSNGHKVFYTLMGISEEDPEQVDCPDPRKEKNTKGECECKEEYTEDEKGNCLSDEELISETQGDAGGEKDCNEIKSKYELIDFQISEKVVDSKILFDEHYETAFKELYDLDIDPCKNGALATSISIVREEGEKLADLSDEIASVQIDGLADVLFCPEEMESFQAQMTIINYRIAESLVSLNDLNEKYEKFNCKDEEIDDLQPEIVQDPSRNPVGEIPNMPNVPNPGEGPISASGFDYNKFAQCFQDEGFSPDQEDYIAALKLKAEQVSAAEDIYDEEPTLGNCQRLKILTEEYYDLFGLQYRCAIAAGAENSPEWLTFIQDYEEILRILENDLANFGC